MNYFRQISFWMLFLLLFVLAACGSNEVAPTTAPVSQATEATPAGATPVSEPTEVMVEPTIAVTMTKLNLNTATGDEFRAAIPGLGNNMVREFEEYRPYVSITQFRREIGKYVSDAQVAEYEKYVYVPADVNNCDAETLKQIPGVDDTIAAALIAGRQYASNDDFLATLATYVTAENVALAAAYLVTQ